MGSTKIIVSYCALSMAMTMMHTAFNFYYVKVFLNKYSITESWFHVSQMLYMVWNAVNDPLFAIFQDNTSFLLTRTRREGVLYTAPLFAFSFLIPWFHFGTSSWAVGLHLIVSLFLYDTMFTFVGLLCCCLFTELSADPHNRLLLTRYSTIASLIGAQSIFLLDFMSDGLKKFQLFQLTAVGIACCSCFLLIYTGLHAHTAYDLQSNKAAQCSKQGTTETKGSDLKSDGQSFCKKMLQLFTERNFVAFVVMNFFQEFHRAFLNGFTAILCDYLVPDDQVPSGVRSFFYGMTGTMAGILVILGTPLVGRIGYFHVIRYNFTWKIIGGILMYLLIGSSSAWLIMVFILLDSAFAAGTAGFFNMAVSDICDQDMEKHNRKHPISSTVFGSNALVVKPAQSLCPMLVVSILNKYGYEQLKNGSHSATEVSEMKSVMFQLICFFPLVLGALQYIVWSLFTIRRRIVEKKVAGEVI